jgi:DNA-binding transcriptional regulator YdaS (Cro superfamily)
MWKARGKVPADHCPEIERLTKRAVTCEELRPDVNWGVLRRANDGEPNPAPSDQPPANEQAGQGGAQLATEVSSAA